MVKVGIAPEFHASAGELDHHISALGKFRSHLSVAGHDAGVRTLDKTIGHLRNYQEILAQVAAQQAEYLKDLPIG